MTLFCVVGSKQASTQQDIASRYVVAVENGDWDAVAEMLHPLVVTDLKNYIIESFDRLPDSSYATPGMERRINSKLDALDAFSASRVDDLRQLDDIELLKTFFKKFGNRQGSISQLLSKMSEMVTSEIVGSIQESPDVTHVLRRVKLVESPENEMVALRPQWRNGLRMDVITLRKDGNEWKIWMDSGIPLASSVQSMMIYR